MVACWNTCPLTIACSMPLQARSTPHATNCLPLWPATPCLLLHCHLLPATVASLFAIPRRLSPSPSPSAAAACCCGPPLCRPLMQPATTTFPVCCRPPLQISASTVPYYPQPLASPSTVPSTASLSFRRPLPPVFLSTCNWCLLPHVASAWPRRSPVVQPLHSHHLHSIFIVVIIALQFIYFLIF